MTEREVQVVLYPPVRENVVPLGRWVEGGSLPHRSGRHSPMVGVGSAARPEPVPAGALSGVAVEQRAACHASAVAELNGGLPTERATTKEAA